MTLAQKILSTPRSFVAVSLLLFGLGTAGPLLADEKPEIYSKLTEAQVDETEKFALNNAIATVFHESGHMLVSEFSLPVLGKEEDAVDGLGALILLLAESDNFNDAVMDSANEWFLSAGTAGDDDEPAYWDSHGLDEQRAYNIVCWAYGKNPAAFKYFADSVELPEGRAEECEGEYTSLFDSWTKVLAPYVAEEGAKTNFTITYEETDDDELDHYRTMIKDAGVLEMVQAAFSGTYALKDGIKLTAKACDEENAYWDGDEREMTLCYEEVRSGALLNAQWYVEHPGEEP